MERNTNLLAETVSILARHGHVLENIQFVSLYGVDIDVDEFVRFASDFNYDANDEDGLVRAWYESDFETGFGGEYVPPFYLRMNDGSWYERVVHNSTESWEFHMAPKAPEVRGSIARALDRAGMAWLYKRAYEHAENTAYEVACAEELAKYEAALYEERMDAITEEIESDLDKPTESGKWAGYTGKCACKSRCQRHVYNERRYELGGGDWSKRNSRCWKDQRKTKHQYHTITV